MNRDEKALSRRAFVEKIATGAAGAAVALTATAAATQAATQLRPAADDGTPDVAPEAGNRVLPEVDVVEKTVDNPVSPPPWGLLSPLGAGSDIGYGWRLADLSGVKAGSCVLTMENGKGRQHRVHVCRNDGRPQGIIYTDRLDLVVMNGGQGDLPTDEGFGQALAKVSHVLARNERDLRHGGTMAELLPQSERAQRYADTSQLR